MLAGTIKGIISQRLVPRADGGGRTAIAEILTMTGRVHDLILERERTGELGDVVAQSEFYGMQTFDQGLYKAVEVGLVTVDDAVRLATRPYDLKLLIQTGGQLHTTMDDVLAAAGGEPAAADVQTGSPATATSGERYSPSGYVL